MTRLIKEPINMKTQTKQKSLINLIKYNGININEDHINSKKHKGISSFSKQIDSQRENKNNNNMLPKIKINHKSKDIQKELNSNTIFRRKSSTPLFKINHENINKKYEIKNNFKSKEFSEIKKKFENFPLINNNFSNFINIDNNKYNYNELNENNIISNFNLKNDIFEKNDTNSFKLEKYIVDELFKTTGKSNKKYLYNKSTTDKILTKKICNLNSEEYNYILFSSLNKLLKSNATINISSDCSKIRTQNSINISKDSSNIINEGLSNIQYKTIQENLTDPFLIGEYGNIIQWKAIKILSEGNISCIYKSLDLNDGKIIAVKRFNFSNLCDKAFEYYNNEIMILKNISNPNIVKYLGSEIDNRQLYIYLEYMTGGSLRNLINKVGPLNNKIIKKYLIQLINAIEYIHSKRIIHKDIKASNILIDNNGIIKLSDFGISSYLSNSNYINSIDLQSQSEHEILSCLKGTIPWMAPEVINTNKYSKKSDIWSLGCVILEMVTGDIPWYQKESNYIQIMLKISNQNEKIQITNHIDDDLKIIIKDCLERNPIDRPKISALRRYSFFTR